MPSPGWIRIVITLAAGAMFGLSALTGDSIDQQGLRWLGVIAGGITLLLLAFDRWLWRWPGLRLISELTGTPVLHGTWRGHIDYLTDGKGNPGTIEVYMAIHQTYSDLSLRCHFPKAGSVSWSLAASLSRDNHRHQLLYVFQQQAPAPQRDENRPTQGACDLEIVGRPVEEIAGSYYTERGGKGTVAYDGHSAKVAGSSSQALRLTYRNLPGAQH